METRGNQKLISIKVENEWILDYQNNEVDMENSMRVIYNEELRKIQIKS